MAIAAAMLVIRRAPRAAQSGRRSWWPPAAISTALDQAQPGQVVQLQAVQLLTATSSLAAEGGQHLITVRTSTADAHCPGPPPDRPGARTAAGHAALRQRQPCLAHGGRRPPLALIVSASRPPWRRCCHLGTGCSGNGPRADDLILDRNHDPGRRDARAEARLALNSANTFIRNSYIGGIRLVGQETQAIAGWNGPDRSSRNNYLEAAGIGVLFGGAEPASSAGADATSSPPQPHHAAGWREKRQLGREELLELRARYFRSTAPCSRTTGRRPSPASPSCSGPRPGPERAVEHDRARPLREQRLCGTRARASTSSATRQRAASSCATSSSATTCSPTSITATGAARHLPADRRRARRRHVEHNTVLQSGNSSRPTAVRRGAAPGDRLPFATTSCCTPPTASSATDVRHRHPPATYFPQSVVSATRSPAAPPASTRPGTVPDGRQSHAQFENPPAATIA